MTGIYEQSRHSVYAIANGRQQDEGGPLVILHWNGSVWSKVAGGNFGFGTLQQLASDGHGGLWLPMPGAGGQKSYLLHYSGGHLTQAALPGGPNKITVEHGGAHPRHHRTAGRRQHPRRRRPGNRRGGRRAGVRDLTNHGPFGPNKSRCC